MGDDIFMNIQACSIKGGRGGVLSLNYFQFYHVNFMKLIFFQAGKKSEPPLDQHMHIIDLYRYA